jgi:glycosyltransferase involved in cell wall biosynthesis/peptidoglycan/xylan/chitin deacetylase (PgdA/CDA1 family)
MVREMIQDPKGNPLVSVIVPFLNGEKFIREAIESVFAQSYTNWEMLLVDDGSSDQSTHIAKDYEARHPGRVRYLEHDGHRNLGQSAARNLGMRHANGELFACLDCDDVWLPHKLERQVSLLVLHPEAGMVFGASEYWRSWTQEEGVDATDYTPDLGVVEETIYQPPELLVALHPLGEGTAPCPSDLLIRRRVFPSTGGFPEEFHGMYSMYEDQVFLARVYLREPVYISGETWIRYRVHPESVMSTVKSAGQDSAVRLFFLTYLDGYLAEQGVRDSRIWALLRKALRPYGRTISMPGIEDAYTRELKWQLRFTSGNSARLLFPPDDLQAVRVEIAKAGTTNSWDIQLNQPDLPAKNGQTYRLEFRIRADRGRSVNLGFARAHDPWDNLGLYRTLELTPDWQEHSIEFAATADDGNARIHFDLGGNAASIELTGLILCCLPEGQPVEPGVVADHYPADRWMDSAKPSREALPGEGGASPQFSVVIPTYQRRELVLRAVRSLANQDFDGDFEIIVVVDGSRDGTGEALRALQLPVPLKVLEQSNQGLAAARNRGASAARGEVLLFLDDDMEAHPRLLAEHARCLSEGADAVLGHFPLHPESPVGFLSEGVKGWVEERRLRLLQIGTEFPLHDLAFGQASVKREWFQSVGGFDSVLTEGGTWGNEDTDFGHRLLKGGCKVVFNPYALSYQNYVIQPRQFLKQIRERGRVDVLFARKHPGQAGALFGPRFRGRTFRAGLWRVLAALRPFSVPVAAALRSFALALVDRKDAGTKSIAFFYEIFEMEYWRGVREGGGMPRLDSVRVLAYHAIRDLRGDPVMAPYGMPGRQFRSQMRVLQRLGFHFISADQFLRFLEGSGQLPPRPVLLTFDDCYDDLLETAMPILEQFGISAVAFAVSGLLGASNLWDQPRGARVLRLLDRLGLERLARNGVEIGAHSRTHRPLKQAGPAELAEEVAGSVEELGQQGIDRPRTFAYPYGSWDFAARRAVREAGLRAAFTVDSGFARQGQDPYLIPRIQILRQDTGLRFLWKVLTAA